VRSSARPTGRVTRRAVRGATGRPSPKRGRRQRSGSRPAGRRRWPPRRRSARASPLVPIDGGRAGRGGRAAHGRARDSGVDVVLLEGFGLGSHQGRTHVPRGIGAVSANILHHPVPLLGVIERSSPEFLPRSAERPLVYPEALSRRSVPHRPGEHVDEGHQPEDDHDHGQQPDEPERVLAHGTEERPVSTTAGQTVETSTTS
jgi:hypothetical protein